MNATVIGFIPPIVGVEGIFNTFRMGKRYARLASGEEVFLMDEKNKVIFGRAVVLDIAIGPVSLMCSVYAEENHTELGAKDAESSQRLYKLLEKIYGPHIVKPNRTVTVIKLKRVIDEGAPASSEFSALRGVVHP